MIRVPVKLPNSVVIQFDVLTDRAEIRMVVAHLQSAS